MQESLHNGAQAYQYTPKYEVESVARDFGGEELNRTNNDLFSSKTSFFFLFKT